MTFTVAFICTGNVCRSPAAEWLFRARMRPGVKVHVWSAGLRALSGYGIDGPTAGALREWGLDPSGHVAQRVDYETLRAASLVLTATSEHRAAVLQTSPALMRKTFTLLEFSRLAGAVAPFDRILNPHPDDLELLRDRVRAIAERRGQVPAVTPYVDDIPDPYGQDAVVARETVAKISLGVDRIVEALGLQA